MKLRDYTDAALKFAADSAAWGAMEPFARYTTGYPGQWEETTDNAHGGLDLSWAFHERAAVIRDEAPRRFISDLAALLEQGIDEGWDAEQLRCILDLMR